MAALVRGLASGPVTSADHFVRTSVLAENSPMGNISPVSRHQSKHSEFNLAPHQIRALIAGARSLRDRTIISLFAYTGMRRAELRGLSVGDVDLETCRLHVRCGKGGKSRFVFFPAHLCGDIEAVIGGNERGSLFRNKHHQQLSLRSINNIVAAAARIAGLDNPNPHYLNVTPHLLRHSFARNWKRSSGSLESLQKILGHSSFSTTMDLYGTESLDDTNGNYICTIQTML